MNQPTDIFVGLIHGARPYFSILNLARCIYWIGKTKKELLWVLQADEPSCGVRRSLPVTDIDFTDHDSSAVVV